MNITKCARVHVLNLCFSTTHTFLFETAAKLAVRYGKIGLAKKCTEVRIFMRPDWKYSIDLPISLPALVT